MLSHCCLLMICCQDDLIFSFFLQLFFSLTTCKIDSPFSFEKKHNTLLCIVLLSLYGHLMLAAVFAQSASMLQHAKLHAIPILMNRLRTFHQEVTVNIHLHISYIEVTIFFLSFCCHAVWVPLWACQWQRWFSWPSLLPCASCATCSSPPNPVAWTTAYRSEHQVTPPAT